MMISWVYISKLINLYMWIVNIQLFYVNHTSITCWKKKKEKPCLELKVLGHYKALHSFLELRAYSMCMLEFLWLPVTYAKKGDLLVHITKPREGQGLNNWQDSLFLSPFFCSDTFSFSQTNVFHTAGYMAAGQFSVHTSQRCFQRGISTYSFYCQVLKVPGRNMIGLAWTRYQCL